MMRFVLLLLAIPTATSFLQHKLPSSLGSSTRSSRRCFTHERRRIRCPATRQDDAQATKTHLLDILLERTPRNAPTSNSLTSEILTIVRELEGKCPTPDINVLKELAGTWELLWTTQDRSSPESKSLFSWINPLENQSYSNNPSGRSNPVLPRQIQDTLEQVGLIDTSASSTGNTSNPSKSIRSTQSVDLSKAQVRNVVSFGLPLAGKKKASLTVIVKFKPNYSDLRRIDVKFEACRVRISDSPVNINIPLGLFGPTGWLQTRYIDEDLRITRGHKGSVFVLSRAASRKR